MINLNMADGIRLMTLRRGVDPRKFALLSFGGAAGLHAAEVARELEIKRIIVPTVASVLSAWGMLTSDLRYEVSRTHYGASRTRLGGLKCARLFTGLEQQATGRLRSWFGGTMTIGALRRDALWRARSLRSTSRSTVSTGRPAADLVDRDRGSFPRRHEELYTYASRGQEVVFVNARVAAVGEVAQRGQDARPKLRRDPAPVRRAAGDKHGSASGARFRSTRSMISGPTTRWPARHHRGRDHDGGRRCRRQRHGQCVGLVRYFAALIRMPTFDFNGRFSALSSRSLGRRHKLA